MFKGEKQQEMVFHKKIGFGLYKLVGFNPESNEAIKALGFYVKEDKKEPSYVDKSNDGNERVRLDFYMEEVNCNYKWVETLFLENVPSMSKQDEKNPNEPRKNEYISSTGQTYWAFDETELPAKFVEGDYHHAIKGESLLIDFLKKLINLKWDSVIGYSYSKFFKGNFKELKDDLASAEEIIIPMTVKQEQDAEDPDIVKEYQSSFKAYARGKDYKFVNLKGMRGWEDKDIKAIKDRENSNKELFRDRKEGKRENEKAKWINEIDKVVLRMVDENYGCKNIYRLSKIADYNEGEALPATGKVIDETSAEW